MFQHESWIRFTAIVDGAVAGHRRLMMYLNPRDRENPRRLRRSRKEALKQLRTLSVHDSYGEYPHVTGKAQRQRLDRQLWSSDLSQDIAIL